MAINPAMRSPVLLGAPTKTLKETVSAERTYCIRVSFSRSCTLNASFVILLFVMPQAAHAQTHAQPLPKLEAYSSFEYNSLRTRDTGSSGSLTISLIMIMRGPAGECHPLG